MMGEGGIGLEICKAERGVRRTPPVGSFRESIRNRRIDN
jgi:hypothetical protein